MCRGRVGRIGVELEWLVLPLGDASRLADSAESVRLACLLGDQLPRGSRISWEPGGQLELSGVPFDSVSDCVTAVAADVAVLRDRARAAGARLLGAGLDTRPPCFSVPLPRYQALRRHYARLGHEGDTLLCNTASVQVNVEAGDGSAGWRGRSRRWLLANSLGPALMAMFANSPAPRGRESALSDSSGRQSLRFRTDPFRTGPLPCGGDPRETWTQYALDAQVVGVRRTAPLDSPAAWDPAPAGLTLRRWLRGAGPRAVRPVDVFLHLKSLVPPVRACGHLELRMIDAQEGDDWMVPPAVVAALLDDEPTSDAAASVVAERSLAPTRRDWVDAARHGLADPQLAALARETMTLALSGLKRLGVPPEVYGAVERFAEQHTLRGLAPAHTRQSEREACPAVPEGVTTS
ncbi:glutamate-cysteine ligase family protein [Streptomyces bauhiniae]|uniref:glutamate-cysteine ligase family protein n=1 Tax=Streptomyces bauhiniae TaxID=2340725 RepID=UPI00367F7322